MPQDLFILRREHEQAFAHAGLERFIRRLHSTLQKKTLASAFAGDDLTSLEGLRAVVIRARDRQLKTERQMSEFAEAEAILRKAGSSIDACAQCSEVLGNNKLKPGERSRTLLIAAQQHSIAASRTAVAKR